MPRDKTQTCGNCNFFNALDPTLLNGQCLVASPQVLVTSPGSPGNAVSQTLWPVVQPVQWCGQWQRA
jgi:hypothetical protein